MPTKETLQRLFRLELVFIAQSAKLDLPDYIYLTEKFKELANKHANGRLVSVLEGGYSLENLTLSVQAHVLALLKK